MASNLTLESNWNVVPELMETEIDVSFINDFTRENSTEDYFVDYFSENWVAVEGSENCVIKNEGALKLPKQYL